MSETVVDYIKKSFDLKNKGYYKPAIEMLYKALSMDEDNIEILAQLAHLYKLLNNYDRAVYYIDKVLELQPKHTDCLALMLQIKLHQKDFKSASEISKKVFIAEPNASNLAKRLSILNELKEFEEIKKLQDSHKNLLSDEVLFEIAKAYYSENDTPKAIELLNAAYEKNKKNIDAALLLAKIHYETNKIKEAQKLFEALEKNAPNAEVMNYLGLIKLNSQLFVDAIDYFKKAYEAHENNAQYAYNLASAYFLNGWLDEALKYFNLAICHDEKNITYHYSLAYLYYQKKSYEHAQKELDFIKKIDPEHSLSKILEALIISQKGDLLEAKEILETIIKNNSSDDFAYSALCDVQKSLGLLDSAKKSISKAVEINPDSLEYKRVLADINFAENDFEKAEEIANNMIEINDKYLPAYLILAQIYLAQKDFINLFETAQDIIKLDSNCSIGYYFNAISLFEQNDTNFAIESLKKSISLDLSNASLYLKMSEFYQDLGDFKNAYAWAKEACEVDGRDYKAKWLTARLAASLKLETEALKYYSLSYRQASSDKELGKDYANYLTSVGKASQAKKILK